MTEPLASRASSERATDRRAPPIDYIARTRAYYAALGYPAYRWARYDDVPFTPLANPLAATRLALITTAAPFDPALGDQGPHAPYNAAAKFYTVYERPLRPTPDLRVSHIGYDRVHTSAADPNTWLPVRALERALAAGRIGALADRVIGMPTDRSQAQTIARDAPAVLRSCIEQRIDAALLVPNCPVCHQSTSLVARHLEAHGIATVVMGCARDIVAQCGVARFLFSDFPLGNSAGKPFDEASQRATLEAALDLLERATAPRTIVASPQRWADDDRWKDDFLNIERLSPYDRERLREEFDAQKAIAKGNKRSKP